MTMTGADGDDARYAVDIATILVERADGRSTPPQSARLDCTQYAELSEPLTAPG